MSTIKKPIKILVEDEDKKEIVAKKSIQNKKGRPKKSAVKTAVKARKVLIKKKTVKKEEKEIKKKIAKKEVTKKEEKEMLNLSNEENIEKVEEKVLEGSVIEEKGVIKNLKEKKEIIQEEINGKNTIQEEKNNGNETKEEEINEKSKSAENILKEERSDDISQRGGVVKEVIDSTLEEEKKKEETFEEESTISPQKKVGLYKKFAFIFFGLTFVLLAFIFYFSFVKVTIVLVPNQEKVSNNMIIDIYNNKEKADLNENSINGVVKLVNIEYEKEFNATGQEIIGQEAIGNVVIVNNYNKNQPLVATTRLLAADGKLFRLKNTVNIPSGGSVEAEIYADEPSPEMAIGPTKFTIPGLWAGLQDKIYAESSEDIVYQKKVKKYILQEDLDNSIRDLKKELLTKAKEEIDENYKDYGQTIYKIDENSIEDSVDSKMDDEKDKFNVSMRADVIVVAFDDNKARLLAKQKFMSSLSENKELIEFDENNIIYSLNNYDYIEGIATINSTFEGKISLKENSEIVQLDKILGLNKQQLETYLSDLPEIAGFEVKFFPSFIKKVPKLVDRINIQVKK